MSRSNRLKERVQPNNRRVELESETKDKHKQISDRLAKHTERLDQAKRRFSEVEDKQVTMAASQKRADQLLLALQSKTEALEARSRQNNL
ncbi:hypothetical protein NDU88_005948 [Pleurodeles waltl]|uniref:Uncharacterized protein n=1 Tax=Pleurodeles waltl TaxID=8319 RepID=A0AAV7TCJ5_PLEWA|nr:hypothetical protein NDU88_005948 [Pleurodeles waltl]